MKILKKFVDKQKISSLSTKFRKKRFAIVRSLIMSLHPPLRILDVGGTQVFWDIMGCSEDPNLEIVILNLFKVETSRPNFRSLIGDATKMVEFKDKEFDVVFSNSVIEHVGSYGQQRQMAKEIKRIGKRYIIQTPNRFFPIGPHFLFPFFQFFPTVLKVFLVRHFDLRWFRRIPEKEKALKEVILIRLLTEQDLKKLFCEAIIYKERFFSLTKSFIVYSGFDSMIFCYNKHFNKRKNGDNSSPLVVYSKNKIFKIGGPYGKKYAIRKNTLYNKHY